jgi:hypothetical protein
MFLPMNNQYNNSTSDKNRHSFQPPFRMKAIATRGKSGRSEKEKQTTFCISIGEGVTIVNQNRRVLIIGADGLRPDNISRDVTPTCWRLAQEGTLFSSFHSAYPSATRVCMSTLTTGTYPGRHGVFANLMRVAGFPLDEGWVQTGNDKHIRTFEETMEEPFLLRPTLGDRLQRNGKTLAVAASSSPGASFIWNIRFPENVLNPSFGYKNPDLEEKLRRAGFPRKEDLANTRDKVEWATRALIELLLPDPRCDCMVLWLNEPDAANHAYGMGSPQAVDALRLVDRCVAEVLSAVERLGLRDRLDLMLISDHGHSSVKPQKTLSDWLQQYELQHGLPKQWITSDYYLYFTGKEGPETAQLQHLIDWLYGLEWCGLVFAHPEYAGSLSGVISMEALLGPICHNRIPALAVNPRWSDAPNRFGVPGSLYTISKDKHSTHGSTCPYEMRPFCLGYGPSFKERTVSDVPCGIVDIAPTVCHLLGLTETGFDGRVLTEGLKGGAAQLPMKETLLYADSEQTRGLRLLQVGDTRYVDGSFFHTTYSRGGTQ